MEVGVIENGVLITWKTDAESITIPNNVQKVRMGAFLQSPNIKEILVDKVNENLASFDGVLFTKDMKTLVAYPQNKQVEEYVIPDSVTNIDKYAFFGNEQIVSLIMPDSVTEVGENAFAHMERMEHIRFSKSLKRIPSISFCNVKEVTIPEGIKTIGKKAFAGCRKIKKITIPQGVEVIEENAFADTSIEEITLPNYLVDIHPCAFGDNELWKSNLKEICASKGSKAEAFAKEKGFKFKELLI